MSILSNPWFIGIVGGILSGLFTALITRWIFSRRENREYLQRVATANREVIYAIRPGIPEGELPSTEVTKIIIASTARKYGIEAKDMLSAKEVAEDLMKEVMDSNFISSKSKAEFCTQLAQLMSLVEPHKPAEIERPVPPTALSEYRERTRTLTTMMMGLFSALMTFTIAFTTGESFSSPLGVLLPTLVAMLGVFIAAYFVTFYRYIERRRQQREQEIKERISEETSKPKAEEQTAEKK
jgi:hypothetical protein